MPAFLGGIATVTHYNFSFNLAWIGNVGDYFCLEMPAFLGGIATITPPRGLQLDNDVFP